jgi:hypothetical protein
MRKGRSGARPIPRPTRADVATIEIRAQTGSAGVIISRCGW